MSAELAQLSALYSAKCLENSQLDEKMALLLADKENHSLLRLISSFHTIFFVKSSNKTLQFFLSSYIFFRRKILFLKVGFIILINSLKTYYNNQILIKCSDQQKSDK